MSRHEEPISTLPEDEYPDMMTALLDLRGLPNDAGYIHYVTPPDRVKTIGDLYRWNAQEIKKIFNLEYYKHDLELLQLTGSKLEIKYFRGRWREYIKDYNDKEDGRWRI